MHPNALLEHATELLHRVLQLKHPADGVISDYFRANRALGSRERHTLAETTYTVGDKLTFDAASEKFVGTGAEAANPLLSRAYRAGFVVPEQV